MINLKQFRHPHTRGGGEVLHPHPPPICVKVIELLHAARPIPECALIALGGGYSHIVLGGVCRWVRESPTLYQIKMLNYS